MKSGDFFWALVLAVVLGLFVVPASRDVLIGWTKAHLLIMGFMKFAVLATMGELLSVRMRTGNWAKPIGLTTRILVWGVIGSMIAFMFQLYNAGAKAVMALGLLPGNGTALQTLATAFWTATLMNITFGPAMMCGHRMSDAYLELCQGHVLTRRVKFHDLIAHINWQSFFGFVVGITCPFVWIPCHTLTFLAPPEYRVLISAFLSIVFGALMAYAAKRGGKKHVEPELSAADVTAASGL